MATNNAINYHTMPAITGTGSYVLQNSPTLTNPSISEFPSGASSGKVGYINGPNSLSGAIGSSNTVTNISSTTIAAGDWDIYTYVKITGNGSTTTAMYAWLYLDNTTLPDLSLLTNIAVPIADTIIICQAMPVYTISVSTTTTIYLNAYATFVSSGPDVAFHIAEIICR